jgi:hypothetical protein
MLCTMFRLFRAIEVPQLVIKAILSTRKLTLKKGSYLMVENLIFNLLNKFTKSFNSNSKYSSKASILRTQSTIPRLSRG